MQSINFYSHQAYFLPQQQQQEQSRQQQHPPPQPGSQQTHGAPQSPDALHLQYASSPVPDAHRPTEAASSPNQGALYEQNEQEMCDDSDDTDKKPGKRSGRRKIKIEYIEDKTRRHITFSKRKAGIMKKAYELSTLTGTQVLLLVVSETGLVYTFTTPKLQPLVTKPEGKNLIQTCLNTPDGHDLVPIATGSTNSAGNGLQDGV